MHVKLVVCMVMMSAGAASVLVGELPYGQEQLEECLYYIEPDDYFPNGEPPYVPRRNRDALPEVALHCTYDVCNDMKGLAAEELMEAIENTSWSYLKGGDGRFYRCYGYVNVIE